MSPLPSGSLAVQVMVCGEPTCQVSGGVPLGEVTVTLGGLRLAITDCGLPLVDAGIVTLLQSRSRKLVMVTAPVPLPVASRSMLKSVPEVASVPQGDPPRTAQSTW